MSDIAFGESQEFIVFNRAIMSLQHVTSQGGSPAINVDFGEHGNGNKNFTNKVTIQLSTDELIELFACLDRFTQEVKFGHHGTSRNKMLSVKHHPDRSVLFSFVMKNKQMYYMALSGGQIFRAKSIVIKQVAHGLNMPITDVLAMFYGKVK